MKKVLVSGYIGFNNFGDEAIFYALVNHLKSMDVEVSALCNNPDVLKHKYNINTYHYKDFKAILSAVFNCDILYSGGGSLLQNKTSNFSLYYYLFIIFLAKIFFKKVIIFSQGIEPIIGKCHEFVLKEILKMVDYITVRDSKSQEYLKKLGLKADLTSDPVYSLMNEFKVSDSKEGLVVQLRDFKGFNMQFLDDLANALRSYKGTIKVLSLQNESDESLCRIFADKLKALNLNAKFIPFYNIERIFEIINSSKYVISTRLHGLIISNALKSKTFALIYDEKVKTLTEEFKIPNINLKHYHALELEEKLSRFLNDKEKAEDIPYRKFDWSLTDLRLLRKN